MTVLPPIVLLQTAASAAAQTLDERNYALNRWALYILVLILLLVLVSSVVENWNLSGIRTAFGRVTPRLTLDSLGEEHRLPYLRANAGGTITTMGGALDALGLRSGELVGTSLWDFAGPDGGAVAGYRRALQDRKPAEFEHEFVPRDGHRRVLLVRADPLPDGGVFARGMVVTRYVVELERLRAEVERLREENDEAHRVIGRAAEKFGATADQLIDKMKSEPPAVGSEGGAA